MAKAKSKKVTIEDVIIPIEEQPYVIPENWCWTSLSSVAEWGSGGTPSRKKPDYYEGNIPWIKTGELDDGYIFDSEEKITEDAVAHSSAKLFPTGSVLVAMYGATIGKTAILGIPATTNQACACARCNDSLDNKYLFYYVRSQKYSFIAKGKGGAQPNISQDIIKSYPIPLPPLAEQKRIVEQIESLFAKLDAAREKAEFVISCFEKRKVAIIHKAFDGVLTRKWREANNVSCDSWKMVPLKNCGRWFGGGTPTTSVGAYWENGDIPWITSKDMKDRVIEDSIMHITMDGVENSSANYCDEPAVLFVTRSGILRRVFPVCMVNRPFTVNQDLKACVPTINQEYLYWFCTGYEKDIRDNCMKSGTTVESVEAKKLMDYEVPVASANEQIEVVKQIEDLINKEEIVKELAENVIEKIDVMKKSILAKAFRGELGTNNSEEESAIELLKTILDKEEC